MRVNKPVWLWWSCNGAAPEDVDRRWHAFLHRFDAEHTFRLLKQTLGWTWPKLRDSAAADRWTWLVLAARGSPRPAPEPGIPLVVPCLLWSTISDPIRARG